MTKQTFIKCLNMGNKWEKKLAPIMEKFIYSVKIKIMNYNNPNERIAQRNGIDGIGEKVELCWESKTRTYNKKYYNVDILLETVSVEQTGKLGWFHTSQADVISYCWETNNRQNLMPVGYLILIKELRTTNWFKKILTYPLKRAYTEDKWSTLNRAIPINDFPPGTLYEFNPTIESTEYKQVTLDRPDKITSYFGGN